MGFRLAVFLTLIVFIAIAIGGDDVSDKGKTLVVVDDLGIRQTHSRFFDGLVAMGQELTFMKADDPSLSLSIKGQIAYDSLVLFAPGVDAFGGDFDVPGIVEFIDSGRNAIIAVSPVISDSMRELAMECGVDFEEQHTQIIDHFNYDVADEDGDHTLIVADRFIDSELILGGKIASPVLFNGIAHTVKKGNEFVLPVLNAAETAYSHSPDEGVADLPRAVGTEAVLVSVLQARNNARVMLAGSVDLFSNKYFASPVIKHDSDEKATSSNGRFCLGVAGWTLKKRGLLRIHSFDYNLEGEKTRPKMVTIKQKMECTAVIEEMGPDWIWTPYIADDVAIEWVMLDPYVRAFMKHDNNGIYSHHFTLPDVYGIYKFRLRYRKLGYTFLDMEDVLPVRPYRHTEYERFIPAAYPYYASAFSMLVGFLLLAGVFLYSKK